VVKKTEDSGSYPKEKNRSGGQKKKTTTKNKQKKKTKKKRKKKKKKEKKRIEGKWGRERGLRVNAGRGRFLGPAEANERPRG